MNLVPVGFFGIQIESGKTYTQTVENTFRVTMSALDVSALEQNKKLSRRSVLMVQTSDDMEDKEFILCSLSAEKCEQQPLDIVFSSGETVTFSIKGDLPVHLTGTYVMPEDEDFLSDDEDEEIDSDAVVSTSEEEEIVDSLGSSEDGMSDDMEDELSSVDDEGSPLTEAEIQRKFKEFAKANLIGIEELESSEDENGLTTPTIEEIVSEEEVVEEVVEKLPSNKTPKQPKNSNKRKNNSNDQAKENKKPAKAVESEKSNAAQAEALKKDQSTEKIAKSQKQEASGPKKQVLAGGLVVEDKTGGNGAVAKPGKRVAVRYIGKLKNGKVFDQNTKGDPFKFKLGSGEVIKGWDMGIKGMKVGGTRAITIPANLAYGSRGAPPDIPPNATLSFEVKLLAVL